MTALAKRAVACRGWRWMPGMRSLAGWMVYDIDRTTTDVVHLQTGELDCSSPALGFDDPNTLALPDLDDPATLGCLLALVREAYNDPFVHVCGDGQTWQPLDASLGELVAGYFETEAEALVAALEAAP